MSTTTAYATAFIFLNEGKSVIVGTLNGCGLGNVAGIFLTNSVIPSNPNAVILEKTQLQPGTTSPLTQLPGFSVSWDGNATSPITATYNGVPKPAAVTKTINDFNCCDVNKLGINVTVPGCPTAGTRQISSTGWVWILILIIVILVVLYLIYLNRSSI